MYLLNGKEKNIFLLILIIKEKNNLTSDIKVRSWEKVMVLP